MKRHRDVSTYKGRGNFSRQGEINLIAYGERKAGTSEERIEVIVVVLVSYCIMGDFSMIVMLG